MRNRPLLSALVVLALLSLGAIVAILVTPASVFLRGRSEAAQALAGGAELASPPPGFRNFIDPGGRFSLVIPESFRRDKHALNQNRFRGPEAGDNPSWILVTVIPADEGGGAADKAQGIEQLDAMRDRMLQEEANLPYTKLKAEKGELASRPAMNRSFLLGAYDGWEVVLDGGEEDSLVLTYLATRSRFLRGKTMFAKVLEGVRFRK